MAAIPGMGIHYQMSRHKKRDMPERQDTGTLREKGLDLARGNPKSPVPFLMIKEIVESNCGWIRRLCLKLILKIGIV